MATTASIVRQLQQTENGFIRRISDLDYQINRALRADDHDRAHRLIDTRRNTVAGLRATQRYMAEQVA